jgi:quercetin dioxygenase-like cupin family protein
MSVPIVNIGLVSNVFVRQMHFESVGDCEKGHKHQFDHLTLLAKGKLSVKIGEDITEYTAPHMIYIKSDVEHELTALSENTVVYCVHALRENTQGDILDPSMVPKGGPELFHLVNNLAI